MRLFPSRYRDQRATIAAIFCCVGSPALGVCPDDFIRQLSANALTKVQKQDLAAGCKGTSFTISGTVSNVDRSNTGVVTITLDALRAEENKIFPTDPWYIALQSPTACGDPARINKGAKLTMKAEFSSWGGYMNRHADAVNAVCR